jgi:hypothetical protein
MSRHTIVCLPYAPVKIPHAVQSKLVGMSLLTRESLSKKGNDDKKMERKLLSETRARLRRFYFIYKK